MKYRRPSLVMAVVFVIGVILALTRMVSYKIFLIGFLLLFLVIESINRRLSRGYVLFLLFIFLLGFSRTYIRSRDYSIYEKNFKDLGDEEYLLNAEISSLYSNDEKIKLVLDNAQVLDEDNSYKCLGSLSGFYRKKDPLDLNNLSSGDYICLKCSSSKNMEAMNIGEFDYKSYLKSQGQTAAVFIESIKIIKASESPFKRMLSSIRKYVLKSLRDNAVSSDISILNSIILANRMDLDKDFYDLMKNSGTAHILAVSGLHMSIFSLGIYEFLRKIGRSNRFSAIISSITALIYLSLVYRPVSAMRATIMLLILFLSFIVFRTYDILSAIFIALIIIVFIEPFYLFSASLHLSFMAVISIALSMEISEKKDRLKGLKTVFVFHVFTLPVILYHFYQFPLYSFIINIPVIALMPYLMYFTCLGIAFSSFSRTITKILFSSIHCILVFYERLAMFFEKLPFSIILKGRPSYIGIIIYYMLNLLIYFTFIKKKRFKKNGLNIFYSFSIAALMHIGGLIILCFSNPYIPRHDNLSISSLYVGQGDGFLLQYNGGNFTIDNGSTSNKHFPERVFLESLRARGIKRIDASMISHGDFDHLSGILYILEESSIDISKIMLPYPARNDERYDKLRELSRKRGTEIFYLSAGDKISYEDLEFQVLYPNKIEEMKDCNAHSLSGILQFKDFKMLFTGDMSSDNEKVMLENAYMNKKILADCDILKLAHHGSRHSNSYAILKSTDPSYAIISYGIGNSYGHPGKETIEKLDMLNIKKLETAKSGEIDIITDGYKYKIKRFK